MPSKNATLFNNPQTSDVTILLTCPKDPLTQPPASKPITQSLFGHSSILSSSSEYFRAAQSGKWANRPSHVYRWWDKAIRKPATITVEIPSEDFFDAAKGMIRYIYSEDLPEDLPIQDFLRLLQLSAKYSITSLTRLCTQRISHQLPAWQHADLVQLLEMPVGLRSFPDFQCLVNKASEQLAEGFLDLEYVWRDVEAREQLLDLPSEVMVLLFKDDGLQVLSENLVLITALSWLRSPRGRSAPQPARKELFTLVRLARLTPSFFHLLHNQVPEFHALLPKSQQALSKLAFYMAANPQQRLSLQRLPSDWSFARWTQPRVQSTAPPPSCTISISTSQICTMAANLMASKSVTLPKFMHFKDTRLFTDGFCFTPMYSLTRVGGREGQTSRMKLDIRADVDIQANGESLLTLWHSTCMFEETCIEVQPEDPSKAPPVVATGTLTLDITDGNNPLECLRELIAGEAIRVRITASNLAGW